MYSFASYHSNLELFIAVFIGVSPGSKSASVPTKPDHLLLN